jgi:hypothetical protein
MARKTVFTPASIDAMISGSIADPETRGLSLDVLPSGKKRWRFRLCFGVQLEPT